MNSVTGQLIHGGVLTQYTNCPDENVIAFKNGTSCTASPYNFYRTDLNGNFIGAALFSTTNTQEINAFGICNADKFIYGFLFDRTPVCTFQNVHFIRLGANGVYDDLGVMDLPAGYTLNTANGCTTQDGQFVFSATNGTDFYAGVVTNITTMLENPSNRIPSTLKLITFNTIARKFSDWAVHPYNGRIYTYGMFTENGKSKGQMVEIDMLTGLGNGMGVIDSVLLTDPTRDNFGGVFFGQDNNLYGANVFDRKLYKIDFTTGTMSVAGTFAGGSGQIRCDMGSCATGMLLLPLQLLNFSMTEVKNNLQFKWNINGAVSTSVTLQQSEDGVRFTDIATAKNNNYSISSPATDYFFRLQLKGNNTSYSKVLAYKTDAKKMVVLHYNNLVHITTPTAENSLTLYVYTITGDLLQQSALRGAASYTVAVGSAKPGSIVIIKAVQDGKIAVQKVQW